MADKHFLIQKGVVGTKTISSIQGMSEDERINELARMLSGSEITEAVLINAREMIDYAKRYKGK